MKVYSSSFGALTLCAPLEAFNSSSDRIKLIQTCCTENSTRCTQICTPNFRHQLYINEISKFNFKGMSDVACDLTFTANIFIIFVQRCVRNL